MASLVGIDIGRYHLVEQLGQGGMATIYKAFDTRLERTVAIKVIRSTAFSPEVLDEMLKRFEREAKALARLSHPNIVKIHDYGDYQGSPYLVMEFLPGGTLKQRDGNSMPWPNAVRLALPVARALAYAHSHNILHRDVKPSNILITESGEPMLSDFGIAKILDVGDGHTLTGTGVGIGTPEYMAPEQGMGGKVDARADVYALGVVLYEMVTGYRPFTADTPMAVILKHMSEPLPRPTQYIADLPEIVEQVLFKAMAKKPEDRYADMQSFVTALERLAGQAAARESQHLEVIASQPQAPSERTVTAIPVTPLKQETQAPASKPATPPTATVRPAPVVQPTAKPAPARQPVEEATRVLVSKRSTPWLWIGFAAIAVVAVLVVVGIFASKGIRQAMNTVATNVWSTSQVQTVATDESSSTPAVNTKPVQTMTPGIAPAPAARDVPTSVSHFGAWVERISFSQLEDANAASNLLKSGGVEIYAASLFDAGLYAQISTIPKLTYQLSLGTNYDLTFNPSGPEFSDGRLNPFASARLRQAINWLVDRNYIVQEIMGGLALPKYLPISTGYAEYKLHGEAVARLERQYAYDPDQARQVISDEMNKLGAKLQNGRWLYKSRPVTLIFIIRQEDNNRKAIGDYVADQLEEMGFTVNRQYKNYAESLRIWNESHPTLGLWHLYTGGWVPDHESDQAGRFSYYYTPRGAGGLLWQAYQPLPDLDQVAQQLAERNFSSIAERGELFARALELALQDSAHVWLVDRLGFTPYDADVQAAFDRSRGVEDSDAWAYTLRLGGEPGGHIRIALPGDPLEPWNPVAGSFTNRMPIRATRDSGLLRDPESGLFWPQRIERAEIVARQGLPIRSTLDWLELSFAPEVSVPSDAWVDWDAVKQRFITVGEKSSERTANLKVTVYYPADLYNLTWHDGSPLSLADFVLNMILKFDRGKQRSRLYDASAAGELETLQAAIRGIHIVSDQPLIIETYLDSYQIDAELNVWDWFPSGDYGSMAWHALAPAILAESEGALAFSQPKADEKGIPWMSFIGGGSLLKLKDYFTRVESERWIPYRTQLKPYISDEEISLRYDNLGKWLSQRGHLWIGTGPFYLDQVTLQTLLLARYEGFPDRSDKWDFLLKENR